MSTDSHDSIDCCGHLCPVPILMTEEKMQKLASGQVLEVIFTDPGAKPDLMAWCKANGHEWTDFKDTKPKYFAWIRKKNDQRSSS